MIQLKYEENAGGPWEIEDNKLLLTVDRQSMYIKILQKNTGVLWEIPPGSIVLMNDKVVGIDEIPLAATNVISGDNCKGFKFYRDIPSNSDKLSLTISIWLNNVNNSMSIELDFTGAEIKQINHPSVFLESSLGSDSYTVLPLMQGCIIPSNWNQDLSRTACSGNSWNGLSMPWWGMVKNGSGYVAICETPDDVQVSLGHSSASDGGTRTEVQWLHSHKCLRYSRKLNLRFFDNATHVTLAKSYREYSKEIGLFKPLKERISQNPFVNRLLGAMVIPFWIWMEQTQQDKPTCFSNVMDTIKEFRKTHSITNSLVVHLDGWGRKGYDNGHPDVLPPAEGTGGWEALIDLSKQVDKDNNLFVLHDNYWLFFEDAPSFNMRETLVNTNGISPKYNYEWPWGKPYMLCPKFAKKYADRNVREILDRGVKLKGIYLDQLSGGLFECYSPHHSMTRSESAEARRDLFKHVQSLGIVTSTEDGADWLQPYVDFVYRTPFPHVGDDITKEFGIPVPLLSLVYHDSIVVPVDLMNTKHSLLQGLLQGGIPLLSELGSGSLHDKDFVEQMTLVSRLHNAIATSEMIDHEFLDSNHEVHMVTYSNGVTVKVDFSNKRYKISNMAKYST